MKVLSRRQPLLEGGKHICLGGNWVYPGIAGAVVYERHEIERPAERLLREWPTHISVHKVQDSARAMSIQFRNRGPRAFTVHAPFAFPNVLCRVDIHSFHDATPNHVPDSINVNMRESLVPQVHIGGQYCVRVRIGAWIACLGQRLQTIQSISDFTFGHDFAASLDMTAVLFEHTSASLAVHHACRQQIEGHCWRVGNVFDDCISRFPVNGKDQSDASTANGLNTRLIANLDHKRFARLQVREHASVVADV